LQARGDVVRLDRQRLLIVEQCRIGFAGELVCLRAGLDEARVAREVPDRRGGERGQRCSVGPLLRGADRRLQERGIAAERAVVLEFRDPYVARAAEVRSLRTNRQFILEQLRVTRRQLQTFIQYLHRAIRIAHLLEQLRDAESLLYVARLAAELSDVSVGGLDGVALLLIAAGDLIQRGPVAVVAFERLLRRIDDAVDGRALRLVDRRDEEP